MVIVKRPDAAGFKLLPKRWIVEHTFQSISRRRASDFARYVRTAMAFVRFAMIRIMLNGSLQICVLNLNFSDQLAEFRPR